jgi:HPt (histidine-containing phosphotransfer) domain-containing protein
MKEPMTPKSVRTTVDTSAPAIDENFLETFYEDFGKEDGFISELIERFFLSAPLRIKAVRSAIDRTDPKALRFEAHSLKNISMNIGGRRFSEVALALEKMGESGSFTDIEQLRGLLDTEYVLLEEALHKKLEKLSHSQKAGG